MAVAPVPVTRPEAPEDSAIPVVTAVAVVVAAEGILGPVRMGDTSRRPCMGPSPSTGVDMDPAAAAAAAAAATATAAAAAAAAVEEGRGATTGGRWRVTDTGGCQQNVSPKQPRAALRCASITKLPTAMTCKQVEVQGCMCARTHKSGCTKQEDGSMRHSE